jgi:hypothetical protein
MVEMSNVQSLHEVLNEVTNTLQSAEEDLSLLITSFEVERNEFVRAIDGSYSRILEALEHHKALIARLKGTHSN